MARFDTGADTSIIRTDTANKLNIPTTYTDSPHQIIFGNGQSIMTSLKTQLGPFAAIVMNAKELQEDLLSLSPFLDAGFHLYIAPHQGILFHPQREYTVPIKRDGTRFMIDLHTVVQLPKDLLSSVSSTTALYINAASSSDPDTKGPITVRVLRLHNRMGHATANKMYNALRHKVWNHHDADDLINHIHTVMDNNPCIICALRRNRIHTPTNDHTLPTTPPLPGSTISADIVGPINPPSPEGYIYFHLFVDHSTGYLHAESSKTKDSFSSALRHVLDFYSQHGHQTKFFRSDSETVLTDGATKELITSRSIQPGKSVPYAHYQNRAERYVQTTLNGVTTLLHGQRFIPTCRWPWALAHFISLHNRTPNTLTGPTRSPSQVVTNKNATDLATEFQFAFGDLVAVYNPHKQKLDLRHDLGIYVGHAENTSRGGYIYYPHERTVSIRTHLIHLEPSDHDYARYIATRRNSNSTAQELQDFQINFETTLDTTDTQNPKFLRIPLKSEKQLTPLHTPTRMQTRSHSKLKTAHTAYSARSLTLRQALFGDDNANWKPAVLTELRQLLVEKRCLLQEPIDTNQQYELVRTTMNLKIKMKDSLTVDKYKARLCVCGNMLLKATYNYAPTVGALTHSLLLQLSIILGWNTAIIDTVGAYLYQEYPPHAKPIYILLPPAICDLLDIPHNTTFRVLKYIYGIPEAGRAYHLAYSQHLCDTGYRRSANDPCLFYQHPKDTSSIFLWTHVDDTFTAATDSTLIDDLATNLQKKFDITIKHTVDKHLGINYTTNDDGSVSLRQDKLIQDILDEIGDIPAAATPQTLHKPISDDTNKPCNRTQYLHLLGQLLYLTRTRPDIATAVSFASSHAHAPTETHMDDLIRIAAYIKGTQTHSMTLHPLPPNTPLQLYCYVDASYLLHPGSFGHTGYTISFGNINPFYAISRKQTNVSTSSTHAECRALYALTTDLIFIIHLLEELNIPIHLPCIVFEDNQPLIDILNDPCISPPGKSKHFLMLVDFIREFIEAGLLALNKIDSEHNLSDLLTKALIGLHFHTKADILLGINHDTKTSGHSTETNTSGHSPETKTSGHSTEAKSSGHSIE